jgi:cytochrome b pre-mRNA-processing protein 3
MLLVSHIWLVHKRLLEEGKTGMSVQEAMFDELWEDTSNRIYAKGVPELSVSLMFIKVS